MKRKAIERLKVIVPDTSVIVEGLLSKKIFSKKFLVEKIIVHEAVLAELENQANKNRETGFLGLEELARLRKIATKENFVLEYKGMRPGEFEIKYAKSGEIDSLMRQLAFDEGAVLVTADVVQAKVAEAKGVRVYLHEFAEKARKLGFEDYFDDKTMSVHFREDCRVMAKRGSPGSWKYESVSKKVLGVDEVKELSKDILENAKMRSDAFVESDRKGSTIIQLGEFRVVLVRPPFNDAYELIIVRQVRRLSFNEYNLSPRLAKRILGQAEGVLVAGAPGHGKSTFVQSIAEKHFSMGKNVRTIENPRDMVVPKGVSRLGSAHASSNEIQDVLLLSRPDFTVFDEVRITEDFRLFSDLRLSGIGVLGVIHATQAVEAIQRFVGRIDLGLVPHVIDTVIFIRNGLVEKVYSLSLTVKVPSGMFESDLARPVVAIHDFDSGMLEFEIYSYGDQTMVVPVSRMRELSAVYVAAGKYLEGIFSKYDSSVKVVVNSENSCSVYLSKDALREVLKGKRDAIGLLEKKLGFRISLAERPLKEKKPVNGEVARFELLQSSNYLVFRFDHGLVDKHVNIFVSGEFLLSAKVGRKSEVKVSMDSSHGRALLSALKNGEEISASR